MAAASPAIERTWLLRSIAISALLGAIAIVLGVATSSQMILLDGVYSVVGIVVSWLLLHASALASQGPSRTYPFGREAVVPLVIGVQGFVLLATLLYAAIESVYVILDGGSDIAAGWPIAYSVVTTVVSLGVWSALRRAAGASDLLLAEATGWRVAAMRGVGMVVGFGAIGVLSDTSWDDATGYIDPAMVLITCALFVMAPIRMVRSTIVELLERSPDDAVRGPVDAAIVAVQQTFELDPPDVRITKLGPKVYVEIETTVGPDVTVAQQHDVRRELLEHLDTLPYDVWLNLELMPRHLDT